MKPQTRPSETMMLILPIGALVFVGMVLCGGPVGLLMALDTFFHDLFVLAGEALR